MQQTTEELQLHIRELKKEITRLHKAVKEQRYGLHWLDVPEAFETETENKIPILEEVKEKAIVNNDGKPTHILIEGDNYHALTCLNYTHKGKIDVIYIDPPYNTGSDGFKYKDKRVLDEFPDGTSVPKDHPLRHSYWLSFMSKRLELAHKLLNDDGFIVISIDDNESAQLKFLCDSIFGISNHIMNFFVQVRYAGKTLVEDMEYQKLIEQVLIYRKTPKGKLLKEKNKYSIEKFEWNIKTEVPNEIIELGGKKVEIFKPDNYKIVKEKANENLLKEIWATGKILDGNSSGRFFRDYIIDRKSGDGLNTLYKVYGIGDDKFDYRFFTGPKRANATKGKYYQGVPIDIYNNLETHDKEKVIVNFADFADSFGNCRHEGGVEFRSGKKPIAFLNSLFKLLLNPKKENILLDFFAGSGSSAHSLLSLNQEFSQNNQFVLVTNNENKIMDDFCYPRIKNILNGWAENNGYGNSLKYYCTSFVGKNNAIRANDTDKVELSHKAGYLLALSENTLNETTTETHYQVFENELNVTAIYFQEDLSEIEQFVALVAQIGKHTAVYIFSWSNGEEFLPMFDQLSHVAIKTIPQPILEIYRSINK